MFSKASDSWETPQAVFDALHKEFAFDMDAAADEDNRKCDIFLSEGMDALRQHWDGIRDDGSSVVWCNPPYSKCAEFVAKAAHEALHGVTTVMLIPSRRDTKYWHAHVWDREKHQPRPGVEIRFIKGRLKFGGGKNSAPFPSVVVVFRPVSIETHGA